MKRAAAPSHRPAPRAATGPRPGAVFCDHCGTPLTVTTTAVTPPSRAPRPQPPHPPIAPSLPATPLPAGVVPEPHPSLPRTEAESEGETAGALPERVLSSGGSPLNVGTRISLERRFGFDFQQIRVQTDAAAQELARLAQARAMTWGTHIIFGVGEYAPTTGEGRRLLAHEIVHTLQQGQGTVRERSFPRVFQRQP